MATITFPSNYNAAALQWKLIMPSQTNVSGWTGQRQTIGSNRGWWECQFTPPPLVGREAIRPWRSFVAQARGGVNDFRVLAHPRPQSTLANTVLVRGGGQTGRSIITDGWPNSVTPILAGDYITIGDQLLQLTADVVSDGSGIATLTFEPPIRRAPSDNSPVEYKNPYALMYMIQEPAISVSVGDVHTFALELREAF
jgi:hypothetical protein